jgi:hypothetical protein
MITAFGVFCIVVAVALLAFSIIFKEYIRQQKIQIDKLNSRINRRMSLGEFDNWKEQDRQSCLRYIHEQNDAIADVKATHGLALEAVSSAVSELRKRQDAIDSRVASAKPGPVRLKSGTMKDFAVNMGGEPAGDGNAA